MPSIPTAKSKALASRRAALRDHLWPSAANEVWSRQSGKGFTSIPRILPLVMHLITTLAKKGDPSRVYLDLWARTFDDGLITITDENEFAFSAGYTGPRSTRTWREHIETLRELGFVRTREQGNRDIAHVLLLDPYRVCVRLHAEKKVSPQWWNSFVARANEIGAEIPSLSSTGDVPGATAPGVA